MGYKKVVRGMGFGYGSKYQLLRMLGWHRNDFNKAIAETLNLNDSNINWLDFGYDGSLDSEIMNADFISELKDKWREYWACGENGINWDGVGIASDGSYILLEAKAHLSELNSSASGKEESVKKNNKRFKELFDKYNINSSEDKWSTKHYQLANRLVITDFINSNGIKAYLVYVLFENGFEYNASKNDSATKEEWIIEMNKELKDIGIKDTETEKLVNICIINCNRK